MSMLALDIETLRPIVCIYFPELESARFRLLSHSWDSVALDVEDEHIFKFPRNLQAEASLRREASLLAYIQPRITMPVPEMTLHEGPRLFSSHRKLKGGHLEKFEQLSVNAKVELAEKLGQFYAELHAYDPVQMRKLGAQAIGAWDSVDFIIEGSLRHLPQQLHAKALTACRNWTNLPTDTQGDTYGFFDGHGWNMAFDAETETLNGIYDFADSGIGPLHQDFIYASLTSNDLSDRIVDFYEKFSGRHLDRNRIATLSGVHRLWELAKSDPSDKDLPERIRQVVVWANWTAR